MKKMEIEKTKVSHIIQTHLEGKKYKTHRATLELIDNEWYIVTRIGTLQELKE
jgi:hypothetical protein